MFCADLCSALFAWNHPGLCAGEGRRVWRALLGSGAPGVGAGMELSTRCGSERRLDAAVHVCGNFHAPALSRKKKKKSLGAFVLHRALLIFVHSSRMHARLGSFSLCVSPGVALAAVGVFFSAFVREESRVVTAKSE